MYICIYTYTHIPGEALHTRLMSIQRDIRGVLQPPPTPPPSPLDTNLCTKSPPRVSPVASRPLFVGLHASAKPSAP